MTLKSLHLPLAWATSLTLACITTTDTLHAAEPQKIATLTTTDGRTYTAVAISKVEPDGIRIMHESGTAKIPFAKLPETLQKVAGASRARPLSERLAKDGNQLFT